MAVLSLLTLALLSTPVSAAKRIAFVVGIDTYDNLGPDDQLLNPVNDARAISRKLQELEFDVTDGPNVSRRQFNTKWQDILDKTTADDTLVLFYSGHGVQVDGQNYLLPRDIPYIKHGRSNELKREALNVSELLLDLRTGDRQPPKVTVMILDACRDDPTIPSGFKGFGPKGGLASMFPPEGTFIMFSAAAGESALDVLGSEDTSKNSVYTRTLLPLLDEPNLSLPVLARELRRRVATLAKTYKDHQQRPAYFDELIGKFCLAECQAQESTATPPDLAMVPQSKIDQRMEERIGVGASVGQKQETVATPPAATKPGVPDYIYPLHPPGNSLLGGGLRDQKVGEHNQTASALLKSLRKQRANELSQTTPPPTIAKAPSYLTPRTLPKEITGKDGAPMVLIPEGEFTKGSRHFKDNPPRKQFVKAFYIDKYEVTVERYAKFLEEASADRTPAKWDDVDAVAHRNHPVAGTDYFDANLYCRWAGKRLPTNTEWEKAARAPDKRKYPWGNQKPNETMTNFNKNYCFFCNVYDEKIAPIGTFKKDQSHFGVFDMAGNVTEWVEEGNRRGGDWRTGWPGADESMELAWIWSSAKGIKNPGGNPDQGFRCAQDAP